MKKKDERARLLQLEPERILPRENQPRKQFDDAALQSLAQSIRENGILEPLIVRKTVRGWELIAGERRLRAAKLVGLKAVPCVPMAADERNAAVCALLENLQRCDLNVFEEAAALESLVREYGVTQEETAERLGMAQSTLANKLRLLRYSEAEREAFLQFGLTERHARALLRIENEEKRLELLRFVGENGCTVAKTEKLVQEALAPIPIRRKPLLIVKDVRIFANTVQRACQTMRAAGIPAQQQERDTGEFLEYIIRIPKNAALRKSS